MHRVQQILKVLILITAIVLLNGIPHALAQNTGAAPYLDSEHAYEVKIGKTANARRWVVTNEPATGSFPYTILKANYLSDGLDWINVSGATTDGGMERVTIFFDRTVFLSTGNYYLQYFEDQLQPDGTTTCISARQFLINVNENDFYFTLESVDPICNGENGEIHTYESLFTDATLTTPRAFETAVSYSVVMHKAPNYNPSSFSFDIDFDDNTASDFSVSVGSATLWSATSTGPDGDGTYSVNVRLNDPTTSQFTDEVTLSVNVTFNNPVLAVTTPGMTLSNGKATKDGSPPAITLDNVTIYPANPATPGDREQELTINALPATRDILPGAGESVWSAPFPLQNSSHNYSVQLGNSTNNREWRIYAADGVTEVTTGFVHNPDADVSDGYDNTNFVFTMDPAVYFIEFEETIAATLCSTKRRYQITLGQPFDADIAIVDDHCSGADSKINNDPLNPSLITQTEVVYNVTLLNDTYDATWEFDFGLTGPDWATVTDIQIVGIAVSGGTPATISNNGTITVTKVDGTPVNKAVTITVTYNGRYAAAHTITATLSNVTGSFIEIDKDNAVTLDGGGVEGEINQARHAIYRMPQTGALAGVE
jgi:hypothetical protein